MSAVPKRKLTVAEYLAIEKKAEFKSEFFDGEMFPLHRDATAGMAGATDSQVTRGFRPGRAWVSCSASWTNPRRSSS